MTEDNKDEYLLDINSLTGTWNSVFKWKPPIENSIDFCVEYKQFKGAQSQIRKINRKKIVSSSNPSYSDEVTELCKEMNMVDNRKDGEIEYRVINLYVGGTENELKRRNDPCNPEMAKLPEYSNAVKKFLFDQFFTEQKVIIFMKLIYLFIHDFQKVIYRRCGNQF